MKNKAKHLTSGNTKGFFDGMKAGDEFTFNPDVFSPGQVLDKATKAGVRIEMGGGSTGNWQAAVTGAAIPSKQPELPLEEPDMKLPLRELLQLPMNRTDRSVESKAAWMACLAKEGMLGAEIMDCSKRMGSSFASYFGATYEYVMRRVKVLEELGNREAMQAVIYEAYGMTMNHVFLRNFNTLLHHGIESEIPNYAESHIDIKNVTELSMGLSKKTVRIIEAIDNFRGAPAFAAAGSPNKIAFDSFEGALIHEMFGDKLYPAATALYLLHNSPKERKE